MPTYEYECRHCGYTFEAFQKISDAHLSKCPKCKKPVKRLISSGAGFIFKGAGFYATDYRKKPSGAVDKPSCPNAGPSCDGCKVKENHG